MKYFRLFIFALTVMLASMTFTPSTSNYASAKASKSAALYTHLSTLLSSTGSSYLAIRAEAQTQSPQTEDPLPAVKAKM
jgi:hypothetical protein